MQPKALADFLELRELGLLYRWLQEFINESPRYHHAVRAVSPDVFVLVFKQVLGLLRGNESAAFPIGHDEVYIKETDRRNLSDLMELLLTGETVFRKEILKERTVISFAQAASDIDQINAAFHRLLDLHVQGFCSDCGDVILDYCRQVQEHSSLNGRTPSARVTKPLRDPLEHRSLAFLPELHPRTAPQETLKTLLQTHREEILSRWLSLLDDREKSRFNARVTNIKSTLSELLDEVLASVGCNTLRAPHLRITPSPIDAAPNALRVILTGEEAIAGLLRSMNPSIDEFWLNLRVQLNDGFHQLLRNNVISECVRCRSLLGIGRNRLRTLQPRPTAPSASPVSDSSPPAPPI